MPFIVENQAPLENVRIEADPFIAYQVSYEANTRMITFSGKDVGSFESPKIVKVKITLVNTFGENPYTQIVVVYASDEKPKENDFSENPKNTT